jgi:carboxypeptidase T
MLRRFHSVVVLAVILAALPLTAMSTAFAAAASQMDAPVDRGLVVRIYYTDRTELAALSARLDVWSVHAKEGYLEAGVSPSEYFSLLTKGYRVEIDTEQTAAMNRPAIALPGQTNGIPGYPCYRTVEETFATAQNIVSNYPTLAQWIDIGDSWEKTAPGGLPGYDMLVLKLTNLTTPTPKPKFFVMSSMHAREYTPAELNTRFAEYLVNNYGIDPDATWLLDYNEVHLLLQANPDGRKHAETGVSWRKNTNSNYCASDPSSYGADLNRNYPFHWGGSGSSGVECDETYRGPTVASEPETQAVIKYVQSQYPDLRPDDLTTPAPLTTTGIFLDLHSYSELVLWPWGFTSNPPPNSTTLQTLGRKFAYFNHYDPEQSIGLYPTDGTTDDFTYGTLGVPAYTWEMGANFFEACSTFENTIMPGNLPALVYAVKAARRPYMTPAGPDVLNVTAMPTATLAGALVTLTASANDTRYRAGSGEPTQNIAAARYTIDAPSWATDMISYPMSAVDGSFNSTIKAITAQLNTTGLALGRHSVFIEAQDASGNWGVPTAVFVWVSAAPDSTVAGLVQTQNSAVPIEGAVIRATLGSTLTFETLSQADGSYQLNVFSGTYTLSATKYGYLPAMINGIGAAAGVTTTQNITLTPAAQYVVSGTVRDLISHRPLAATITISGYPGASIDTNPVTGFYNVTLVEGITYIFDVKATSPGYSSVSRSVGPLTGNQTENFTLSPDLAGCTASGYGWIGVKQAFDTSTLPASWTVVNNIGNAGWRFDNPKARTNYTGGSDNFAIADSDNAGQGVSMDTELRTPPLDFSTLTAVALTFKTDFHYFVGDQNEVADVDVSLNGASGPWMPVWHKTTDYPGPHTEMIDLSSLAAHQPNVMVRFHYYDATFEWWWEVDDVQVGRCEPQASLHLPVITPSSMFQAGDESAVLTYPLQVTNTDLISHTYDVLLSGYPYAISVATPVGPVLPHDTVLFTVTIVNPPYALGCATNVVNVTVKAQDSAVLSATAVLTAVVTPRWKVALLPTIQSKTGITGTTVIYHLDVNNQGNVADTYHLTLEGNHWLTSLSLTQTLVTVTSRYGGSEEITAFVTIPFTATPGQTDAVRIIATGTGTTAYADLTTTTQRSYAIDLPVIRRDQ